MLKLPARRHPAFTGARHRARIGPLAWVLVLGACAACGAPYGKLPPASQSSVEPVELHARFTTAVWGEIWNQGLLLDAKAQERIEKIVERSVTQTREAPTPKNIEETERSLRAFVRALASSGTRGSMVSSVLIDKTSAEICPLFPIC